MGLLLAVLSGFAGMLLGQGFFRGLWWTIDIGSLHYKIGTPVTFDFGVFFAVVGVTVTYLLGLSETIITPRRPLRAGQDAPAAPQEEFQP